MEQRKPRVWILQPRIEHYRTPVFDGLRERGCRDGAYELSVLGTLDRGKAFGGEARDYFRSCPREDFRALGVALCRWPDAAQQVEAERPDVLVMEANPRNTTAWRLPGRCRALRIPVVGWSKIHSTSAAAPAMGLLKPWFFSRFDAMIGYGESSRDELIALGYPADRVHVAHNTVDTRAIYTDGTRIASRAEALRREHGLQGRKILLTIGRMDADKRHQDLIDAWPKLRALDPDLVMVLVSGGPLLDTIRARARAADPERILVTGRVPEGDDLAWIAASDVCVYPGAVGLAINQSLAMGRPSVIADERGADTEILVGAGAEQNGWRFRRGELDALVSTVGHVLRHPDEAARVGARGQALLRDRVTLENMIDAIDGCIRKALVEARSHLHG